MESWSSKFRVEIAQALLPVLKNYVLAIFKHIMLECSISICTANGGPSHRKTIKPLLPKLQLRGRLGKNDTRNSILFSLTGR